MPMLTYWDEQFYVDFEQDIIMRGDCYNKGLDCNRCPYNPQDFCGDEMQQVYNNLRESYSQNMTT